MINPETVSEAVIEYLEQEGVGTFGTDIFLNQVPSSLETPASLYWVLTSGGETISKNRTGEKIKQYFTSIYYRSKKEKDVERKLFELANKLDCAHCVDLTGFEVLEIKVSQYPAEQDLDSEERRIGFLQANIKIYKKEC